MRAVHLGWAIGLALSCGARVDSSNGPPPEPAVPATRIVQLVTDGAGTCVVRGDGTVWCWGWNDRGQLVGDACGETCTTPTRVPGFHDVVQLTRRGPGQCAVLRDHTVVCRRRCRLAGRSVSDCEAAMTDGRPAVIEGLRNVAELALGSHFACARFLDGSVECADDLARKASDPGIAGRATSIAAGDEHACAVAEDASLWCWGSNFDGELGVATETAYATRAVRVSGVHDVDAVATGTAVTCAHQRDGSVWCFGIDDWRPRDEPGRDECSTCDGPVCVHEPVRVDGVVADAQIDIAGWSFVRGAICGSNEFNATCVLGRDTSPWCWGPRARSTSTTPHRIPIDNAARIAISSGHACVARGDGTLWCWGENDFGQLGDGTTVARESPGPVAMPWAPAP